MKTDIKKLAGIIHLLYLPEDIAVVLDAIEEIEMWRGDTDVVELNKTIEKIKNSQRRM